MNQLIENYALSVELDRHSIKSRCTIRLRSTHILDFSPLSSPLFLHYLKPGRRKIFPFFLMQPWVPPVEFPTLFCYILQQGGKLKDMGWSKFNVEPKRMWDFFSKTRKHQSLWSRKPGTDTLSKPNQGCRLSPHDIMAKWMKLSPHIWRAWGDNLVFYPPISEGYGGIIYHIIPPYLKGMGG